MEKLQQPSPKKTVQTMTKEQEETNEEQNTTTTTTNNGGTKKIKQRKSN